MTADAFYAHFTGCLDCHDSECRGCTDSGLCPIGRELLYEAADELPEHWQRELERILRQEQLQREADEQARFYAGMEEF